MRFSCLFVVTLFFIIACQPVETEQKFITLYEDTSLIVSISPDTIPVETPLRIQLVSGTALTQVNAEITGVSMYMGRIPLKFKQNNSNENEWYAEFLLGACSDPDMQWQLEINLHDAEHNIQTLKLVFQSSW